MNGYIGKLIDEATVIEAPLYIEELPAEDQNSQFESTSLTKYITSGLDAAKDNRVAKLMAAAIQINQQSNPGTMPIMSPLQVAVAATGSLKRFNLSYLVEKGAIAVEAAADSLIDQAAAHATVVAETILQPEALEMGMNRALDWASVVMPKIALMAQAAKQYTPAIASFVSNKIKPLVMEGIPKVAKAAKTVVHNVVSKLSKVITTAAPIIRQKVLGFIKS